MIHVIWVDDNCRDSEGQLTELGTQIVDQAWNYGIEIEAFDQYKPALMTLQSNPSRYSAIILDIRNEKAEIDNATTDYHKMKKEIENIKSKDQSSEPYVFSFSGIDQYYNSDLIPKESYASRSVYAKPNESTLLFQDIVKVAYDYSPNYKIQKEFSDVFESLDLMNWAGTDKEKLTRVFKVVSLQRDNRDDSALNDMRKIIEIIMGVLSERGLVPDNSNLATQSKAIGDNKEIPVYIQRSFHSIVEVTNNGSHALLRTTEDIKNGEAPYVLRSCMYELCNIIIWLGKVVNNNQLI